MEKFEFIEYTAKRYGIDESLAETMIVRHEVVN